eukprot:TRINITY_DN984_c0_g2_i1.p1 TRINITY_DN984_c0_g2~~TRINITY_DN984_c0_g2_i1.p1  ORF type:complete len:224 (+),score=34.15 TRINITY_DN984_c0_g2_i1:234-905(+)
MNVQSMNRKSFCLILSASCAIVLGLAAKYSLKRLKNKTKDRKHVSFLDEAMKHLELVDAEQKEMMREKCILVNKLDEYVGASPKAECHLLSNIEAGMIHRAFSVFMFSENGKLLLQKRAKTKITFPSYWANTCCSHPLHCDEERHKEKGAIHAAIRKLKQEMGFCSDLFKPSDFHMITRMLYFAPYDDVWGESEVDYVLACVVSDEIAETVNPNPNEVSGIMF